MVKTVKKRAPLTSDDIRRIAAAPENNLHYVLPGLIRAETIQKEEPKPRERRVSPYVLPGL
ncbi:MAG: hypothetical protein WC263_02215 [Candidatus Micrarchaeia archaeon]|jgi:hypothetical protein